MQKTSFIALPVSECRARLSNVGIGYVAVGDDVYRFNSVQKKGDTFSFFATVTLRASGAEGTDVTLDLSPDSADVIVPENAEEIYEKFAAKFFTSLNTPVSAFSSQDPSFPSGDFKYCSHCGSKIDKKASICPKCGCSQRRDYMEEKTSAVGIAAIVFSIFGGWLGLVLAIIGLAFYYKGEGEVCEKGRKHCKIAIGFFIAWIVLYVILIIVNLGLMAGAMTNAVNFGVNMFG